MNIVVFILLLSISIGIIYLTHRYFGKKEFYLISSIYSVISFMMCFKMINLFGIYINGSIIFNIGLIMILYYFINKYDSKEVKRLIMVMMLSICLIDIFTLINGIIEPSLYNNNYVYFHDLLINNYMNYFLYPIATYVTLYLSSLVFKDIKKEDNKRVKIILPILGIVFVDVFIFVYFSYGITLGVGISFMIAFGNYIVKSLLLIFCLYITNKIIKIKKVKA